MNDLDLRPRSPTETVDAAFQLFRRSPTQFLLAAALVFVPWLAVRLVFDIGISDPIAAASDLRIIGFALIIYSIASGALCILATDAYLGRPVDLPAAFRRTLARAVPLVAASLIRALFIVLGLVLFLFPGLYALGRYFAVVQVLVLENASLGGAISRSAKLSVGLKRHIVGTILLIGLVSAMISFGAGLLAELVGSAVLVNVVSTAANVVIYPLFALTETLLYYDARIRKEGFDVEYLAGAGAFGATEAAPI
jgi:hypothetical protein